MSLVFFLPCVLRIWLSTDLFDIDRLERWEWNGWDCLYRYLVYNEIEMNTVELQRTLNFLGRLLNRIEVKPPQSRDLELVQIITDIIRKTWFSEVHFREKDWENSEHILVCQHKFPKCECVEYFTPYLHRIIQILGCEIDVILEKYYDRIYRSNLKYEKERDEQEWREYQHECDIKNAIQAADIPLHHQDPCDDSKAKRGAAWFHKTAKERKTRKAAEDLKTRKAANATKATKIEKGGRSRRDGRLNKHGKGRRYYFEDD